MKKKDKKIYMIFFIGFIIGVIGFVGSFFMFITRPNPIEINYDLGDKNDPSNSGLVF